MKKYYGLKRERAMTFLHKNLCEQNLDSRTAVGERGERSLKAFRHFNHLSRSV